ncbi:MAG: hypothetical protein AB7U85_05970 [Alphaproteobacteria bacterium]
MSLETADIYEFEKTFTNRPELAEAYFNIKRIFDSTDEVNINELSEEDIRSRFSSIRGSLAVVYAKADDLSEKFFNKSLINLAEDELGANILNAINEMMDFADVDDDKALPSDLEDRCEKISILATRLERALSDFDEDLGKI